MLFMSSEVMKTKSMRRRTFFSFHSYRTDLEDLGFSFLYGFGQMVKFRETKNSALFHHEK